MIGHTKSELLTSRVAKGKSPHVIGSDGKPTFRVPVTPTCHLPKIESDAFQGYSGHDNIARSGSAKDHHAVEVHGAMHHMQDGGLNAGISRTQSSAALSNYALPTDPPLQPNGKALTPPTPAFGMRSRVDESSPESPGAAHRRNVGRGVDLELSRAIFNEAVENK